MACIFCLAVLAAVGVSAGIGLNEWLEKKLAKVADSGALVHETESVATWRGELHATLDDGSEKSVSATIRIYKDSGRVTVQIDDHSLTQEEAERLEDEVAAALDAEIVERRYPRIGPDGLPVFDHSHDEPEIDEADAEDTAEEAEECESDVETETDEEVEIERQVQRRRQ
jgi:hypothetical protein